MLSAPLLPGAPRPRRASRTAAAVIAGVCAVGAIAAVAVIVHGGGPAALLQKAPVYYIKQARAGIKAATQKMRGAVQPPVVYYYLPNEAKADAHPAAQHATAAQTLLAANDTAKKFVCSVENIKSLSAEVQTKWDECKTNTGYKEPNKDAKRRLLGWVWEPDAAGEKKTAKPKHSPEHYHLKLSETDRRFAMHSKLHTEMKVKHNAPAPAMQVLADANATNGDSAKNGVSFDDCEKKAAGEACAVIAGCANPVCDSYYNEPEIEALCGMCTMAPLGCFATSAEVFSYACDSPFGVFLYLGSVEPDARRRRTVWRAFDCLLRRLRGRRARAGSDLKHAASH